MVDWKRGTPARPVLCCLVFYKGDYEFARWDGERWHTYETNRQGEQYFVPASESIEFYVPLQYPEA